MSNTLEREQDCHSSHVVTLHASRGASGCTLSGKGRRKPLRCLETNQCVVCWTSCHHLELCKTRIMSQKMRLALALSALGLLLVDKQRKRRQRIRRNRTKWVKSWIAQRQVQGVNPKTEIELELNESSDFRHFARLFPDQFHMLEELLTPIIRRQNTNYRDCISVGERLMVTLHFLATGERPDI